MEAAGWRMEVNLDRPRITLASSPIPLRVSRSPLSSGGGAGSHSSLYFSKIWRGSGQHDGLKQQHIVDFLTGKLRAPSTDPKSKKGPPRWKTRSAACGVARLILHYGEQLDEALANDWPMEELPTLPEVCGAQTKRIAQLESQLAAANLQVAKVIDAHRKIKERSAAASKARTAAGRALKESVAAARADATRQTEARFQQRHTKEMDALELTFDEALTESQAAERRAEAELEQAQAELVELEQSRMELDEARDEAQAALDAKVELNRLRNTANAAKRTALDACEKAEELAEKRLRRANFPIRASVVSYSVSLAGLETTLLCLELCPMGWK